jgi:hypothetical protein
VRNYLIGSANDALSELATRQWLAECEETIRTTCETLGDFAGSGISAASVTLSQGADGQMALLFGLIEDLADAYSVDVSFRLGQGSITARFTVCPGA